MTVVIRERCELCCRMYAEWGRVNHNIHIVNTCELSLKKYHFYDE